MMKNLLNLFFPKVCHACNTHLTDNKVSICTLCRHELPVTNYHFENPEVVKKVLYGRVHLENATALLRFHKKGKVQKLLHNLKYKGYEEIGTFLGLWLGEELREIEAYKSVDTVIPVPIHKQKRRKRGYNQVEKFGKEIAKALEATYLDEALVKTSATKTQVFKNRISRWINSEEIFQLKSTQNLEGKHLLLVDDIITTGATLEACANELLKAENVKISVATMAIAE